MSSNLSSSNFVSTFAPYSLGYYSGNQSSPPDHSNRPTPSAAAAPSPWFSSNANQSVQPNAQSYQDGNVPTFNTSVVSHDEDRTTAQQNPWDTRMNVRVDVQAAFAYLLGPISALFLLVVETQNDYVRFHAYQAALLTIPLLLMRIFFSLLGFSLLKNALTLVLVATQLYMSFRAHQDASDRGLSRLYLPYIGPLADKWVDEE